MKRGSVKQAAKEAIAWNPVHSDIALVARHQSASHATSRCHIGTISLIDRMAVNAAPGFVLKGPSLFDHGSHRLWSRETVENQNAGAINRCKATRDKLPARFTLERLNGVMRQIDQAFGIEQGARHLWVTPFPAPRYQGDHEETVMTDLNVNFPMHQWVCVPCGYKMIGEMPDVRPFCSERHDKFVIWNAAEETYCVTSTPVVEGVT